MKLKIYERDEDYDGERVCCFCAHNIRIDNYCKCELDDHYISYVGCFENWCRRWKKDRRLNEVKDE